MAIGEVALEEAHDGEVAVAGLAWRHLAHPTEGVAVPVDAREVLENAVRRRERSGDQQHAHHAAGMGGVLQPPEHDEVRDHDPRPRPPDRLRGMPARQRREHEHDVPAPRVGRRAASRARPPSAPRTAAADRMARPTTPACITVVDSGMPAAVHRHQHARAAPRGGRRASLHLPGRAQTPRRVSITLTVSERIFRSSHSERLWM